jgi:hypothetical protein
MLPWARRHAAPKARRVVFPSQNVQKLQGVASNAPPEVADNARAHAGGELLAALWVTAVA